MDKTSDRDKLFNLADALAQDTANLPNDQLFAEAAEDYGDRQALAVEFDQVLERSVQERNLAVTPQQAPTVGSTGRLASFAGAAIAAARGRTRGWLSGLGAPFGGRFAWAGASAVLVAVVASGVVYNALTQSPAASYMIALGPQGSATAAYTSFRRIRSILPSQLAGTEPNILQREGATGTSYTALVGPFKSEAAAREACNTIQSAGGACTVRQGEERR